MLKLADGFVFFILRGERVRFFFFFTTNSKHSSLVTLLVDHAQRNIASARQCIELLLRSKCLFSVSLFIMFLAMQVILGLGAVASPVPAGCLRPYVVARNGAPKCEGDRRSPSAWECHLHGSPVATTTWVSTTATAGKGGDLQVTMETITRARAPSLSHRLHWMTGCRRPRLSACHQVFSRSRSPMPTAHSLASAQSTARCVFLRTMLSRADPWRNQLTCSASRYATLVSHLHADWEPAPVFLEQLSRRSPGPALGPDQRSRRQSDKFQVLSWNPGPARGKDPRALAAHLNGQRHIICIQEGAGFVTGSSLAENVHVATQRHCAVLLNKDTFCARLNLVNL